MSDFERASFEMEVDDPEALRLAEDAAAGRATPGGGSGPGVRRIDEAWATIAAQVVPGDNAGLEDVARALEAEGVDFGWDPYDPRDSVNFGPPETGPFRGKLFTVMVPVSQIAKARGALYGEPPKGVTYAWAAIDTPASGAGGASRAADEFDFVPAAKVTSPAVGRGAQLSDNARMARLAGGADPSGPPTSGALGTKASTPIVIVVALGIVAFLIGLVTLLITSGH